MLCSLSIWDFQMNYAVSRWAPFIMRRVDEIFVSAAFFLVTDSHPTSSCGVPIDATNRITFRRFLVPSRLSSLEASKLLLLFLSFHFCHSKFFCFSGVRVLEEHFVLYRCGHRLSMIKQALYFALRRFIKTRHNFQMRQLNVGSADFLDRRDDSGVNVPWGLVVTFALFAIYLCAPCCCFSPILSPASKCT